MRRNYHTRCHNPVESRVAHLRALSISSLSLAFICIFLRFYTRWDQGIFKADDWLMLGCLIALIPYSTVNFLMMHYGFGRNIWDLEPSSIDSALKVCFQSQTSPVSVDVSLRGGQLNLCLFQVFHARRNLYLVLVALPKISMLLFYIRLIPSTTCKRLAYLLILFVSVTMIVWLGLVNTYVRTNNNTPPVLRISS